MKPTLLARRLGLAAALALATGAGGAARAGDQAAALDVFRALNDNTSAVYQDAKRRFLAAADPVLLVGYDSGSFDGVLVRHGGETTHLGLTPPAYHVLKAVDHVPRTLWAALRARRPRGSTRKGRGAPSSPSSARTWSRRRPPCRTRACRRRPPPATRACSRPASA